MRHAANLISISRMILVATLLFLFNHAGLFAVIYLLSGLSDVLDGIVARKTNTQSELGARLDTVADLMLVGVILGYFISRHGTEILSFAPWIILITLVRCANMAIVAYKYHSFAILHTWGNKLAGLFIFIGPPLFIIYHNPAVFWPACILGILSALEETAVHITAAELNVNRRSIFLG
ncbi:CDP-diacylglycerol--glycerol-3-phosphate 3-phosphatidyltransferase [Fontibacillus phaseoli]|uniref:CDP-diacylglycerol--glycerol-3-phosphate 3-phosphatidyltransferase n=1 Tax=Fontibacillus phaseoli TaxID=1416533 RepID=A0A369BSA4_9BACL|nr:CDP-alcohol phosphatidyltransferase family protein [Fontibacillus phaseoli]RCX23476.1 CDP-diacylglycerol--glycerol-3-phosphate 3-phosphatidyltransferase [Fontibacillus phaseoli]